MKVVDLRQPAGGKIRSTGKHILVKLERLQRKDMISRTILSLMSTMVHRHGHSRMEGVSIEDLAGLRSQSQVGCGCHAAECMRKSTGQEGPKGVAARHLARSQPHAPSPTVQNPSSVDSAEVQK
jgi:hypothetical protein